MGSLPVTPFGAILSRDTALTPDAPDFRIQENSFRVTLFFCLVTAIVISILRFIVRFRLMKRFCPDDYTMIFGLVCFSTYCVLYIVGLKSLYLTTTAFHGHPVTDTALDNIRIFLRFQFAIILLFWANLWSIKLTFLLMFQRFIYVTKGSVHSWIHTMWVSALIFVFLTFWVNVGLQFGSCQPISNFFVIGKCSSSREIFMSNLSLRFAAGSDISTDILIMVVPLVLLQYIRVNKKQKIALAAIFSVGVFIIAFAILRIVMINPATNQADPVWLAFWSVLESTVAIIVCSLPTFKSLLGGRKDSQQSQPVATIREPVRRHRSVHDILDDDDDLEVSSKTDFSREEIDSVGKAAYHSQLSDLSSAPSPTAHALGRDAGGEPSCSSWVSGGNKESAGYSREMNATTDSGNCQFFRSPEDVSHNSSGSTLLSSVSPGCAATLLDGRTRRTTPGSGAACTKISLPSPSYHTSASNSCPKKMAVDMGKFPDKPLTDKYRSFPSPAPEIQTMPTDYRNLSHMLSEHLHPVPFHPLPLPSDLSHYPPGVSHCSDLQGTLDSSRFAAISSACVVSQNTAISPTLTSFGDVIHITRDVRIDEGLTGHARAERNL